MAMSQMLTCWQLEAQLYILPSRRRRVQADQQFEMGSSLLRHMGTRSTDRQSVSDGANHRRREGAS